MDADFDDPTDFNNLAFRGLDSHLRCPICKEFFQTAMILSSCSHTFCALCIRRCLVAEQFCPSCRLPALESQLHNNYVADNMVDIWKNNRESVVDLEKQKEAWGNQEINGIASTDSPMDTGSSQPPVNAVASPPARVTRSSSRRSASQTPIEVEAPIQIAEEAEPLVDCNTCNRKVPLTHLPQHWNLCEQGKPDPKLDQLMLEKPSQSPAEKRQVEFGNQSSPSSSSSGTLKRKVNLGPKPGKIVYSMHSLTQLRKIMRELGLPDSGDHKVLVKRHKEYITLYNANIDSTNPVDAKVLRKRLMQREEILANDAGPAVKRKYSPQFDSLISDAMKRRKKLKEAEQKAKESSKASKSAENNSAPQEAAAGASTATSSEYLDGVTWDLLDDDDFMP